MVWYESASLSSPLQVALRAKHTLANRLSSQGGYSVVPERSLSVGKRPSPLAKACSGSANKRVNFGVGLGVLILFLCFFVAVVVKLVCSYGYTDQTRPLLCCLVLYGSLFTSAWDP